MKPNYLFSNDYLNRDKHEEEDQEQEEEEDIEKFSNRYLASQSLRKKMETDVLALENRIKLLENQESQLLTQIEKAKSKAIEIIEIKKFSNNHNALLKESKISKKQQIDLKQQEVAEMNKEDKNRLEERKKNANIANMQAADSVRDTLNDLREIYKEEKRLEKNSNAERFYQIKEMEYNVFEQRNER